MSTVHALEINRRFNKANTAGVDMYAPQANVNSVLFLISDLYGSAKNHWKDDFISPFSFVHHCSSGRVRQVFNRKI